MDEQEEEMVRQNGRLLLVGAAIGMIAALIAFFVFARFWPSQLKQDSMNYQDLISVVLTALAVLLAVLGVSVAILAIWGYGAFQRMARDTARTYVRNDIERGQIKKHMEVLITAYLNKESADGGVFRQILIEAADRIVLSGKDRPVTEQGVTSDDEDEGDV